MTKIEFFTSIQFARCGAFIGHELNRSFFLFPDKESSVCDVSKKTAGSAELYFSKIHCPTSKVCCTTRFTKASFVAKALVRNLIQ